MARSKLEEYLKMDMFQEKDLKSGQISKEFSFIEATFKIHKSVDMVCSSGLMVDIILEIS